MTPVASAIRNGLAGRCPKCGAGRLFSGYLKLAPACGTCGADFSMADVGDGAAVFVIMIVGALAVPAAFIAQFGFGWPPWSAAVLGGALTLAISAVLLPAVKGVLFTLQWTHKAGEGRRLDG